MNDVSFLTNTDPQIIDQMYERYTKDPDSVDESWAMFFSGYQFGMDNNRSPIEGSPQDRGEAKVMKLILGYRQRGHLFTKTNPVRERRKYSQPLKLDLFGLSEQDLNKVFQSGKEIGIGPSKLKDIIKHLESTYCESVGAEFSYIRKPEMVEWLQTRMESCQNKPNFSEDQRALILKNLTRAVLFEQFLDKKFIAQKRFSIEGVEAAIPALNAVIDYGAEIGIENFVLGMPHRGRLNVLANVVGKPYEEILYEYKGIGFKHSEFVGDVKYHLGYSNQRRTKSGKKVQISLSMNPSHLEAVGPIVAGKARSKIDQKFNGNMQKVVPIVIHGDAAIAGQGVVYEVIQMSTLEGYKTGGTLHITLNNQIGFTTNYLDARSSTYCTDVGKVTLSPVFHVNGDDIEAVVYVVQLALEFRQKFQRDVFIDILGYRKYGHNEGDEPRFTQPLLYKAIETHPNPLEIYKKSISAKKNLSPGMPEAIRKEVSDHLNRSLKTANSKDQTDIPGINLVGNWRGLRRANNEDLKLSPQTGVDVGTLESLVKKSCYLPKDKNFFKKTKSLFAEREKLVVEKKTLNWAGGELLAYATLLDEGFPIRLSGQDVGRGTFSHRHALVTIEDSEEKYFPLQHLSEHQAKFQVFNSLLSEYGVLGFETGYALDQPNCLTIWEAQFGDFANTAQVIFDQYLACSETKWYRMCGLVVYLPHGYEGQGSEHSSARLERFLTLCANNNMQVVNCTTPANFFHVLRRQLHRPFRKPLILMTPKSLLRHPQCISGLDEIGPGTGFQEIYDDSTVMAKKVKKLLLCSGKIYYDLLHKQSTDSIKEIAIIRIEQIYPFPEEKLLNIISKYKAVKEIVWVQEEPENMGAWPYLLRKVRNLKIKGIYRKECETTATGFVKQHLAEQNQIIEQAFS
ncbi:MAG: 2-oxoglutarate dehydrogenase E1 component [Proteobacteria bacterium]|nr:2-oxoglutarate dehydrogenase E1 component [Pseudomonadota bacterium]